jgi:hypothetical protein
MARTNKETAPDGQPAAGYVAHPVSNVEGWPGSWLIEIAPGKYQRLETGGILHFKNEQAAREYLERLAK